MRGPSARLLPLLGLALLALPPAVAAQTATPFDGTEEADTILPKTSYPLGNSEAVARSMIDSMQLERRQRDLCWKLGCIVLVNETNAYQVDAFYVEEPAARGERRWSRNQFGAALLPRRATYRFKTGGPETCDQPVRFVLRHRKTKDKIEVNTRASLCTSPQHDSLVRIRVIQPEVQVGGS
jgi:hypothetical protein